MEHQDWEQYICKPKKNNNTNKNKEKRIIKRTKN